MSGEFLNKTKKIVGLWGLIILSIGTSFAQEVNATVQVVAPRVQLSNKEILNTLQNSIQQFINNRKWTEEKVAIEEKVNFSLFININAINNDQFEGTAQLQVTRPVYNSSYKTTVMQFNDEDISFAYREFENLDYQENMNMNDLTTLMAYYVYIAMGVEFDSFGELGGSPFFSKAQAIVNIMTNKPGWNQGDGRGFRNRFYLADNLNSPRFKDFRKLNYQYHREGMDQFHEDPTAAREQITSSLKLIAETSQSNRNSLLQKLFFTTKWPELVEIYKGGTTAEKTLIVRLLNELDPTNAQRYEKNKVMIVRTETIDERIRAHMDRMQPDKIVVVVSQTSEKLCLPKLEIHKKLDNIIYIVPDGEKAKSLRFCEDFWETMLRENVTRKSLVLAVGGGAVLDFTGFCAATFMRGIPFIYVPTTLLSMVDGSQGGKTGINLYGTKNIIGTFTEPLAVMRNIDFLPSLDTKQIHSGWAEIIKHAILGGEDLYRVVQNGIPPLSDTETWMDIIRKNVILKSSIVEEDFRESNKRKLLNLGHTIGHGIEALRFEEEDITHGLCVANGLYWETLLAEELGVCTSTTTQKISAMVYPLFFKVQWSKSEVQPMLQLLLHDKKNYEGNIQFSLTREVGDCIYDYDVSPERLLDFLEKHAISDQVNED